VAAVLAQLEFPPGDLPLAERLRATVRSLRRLLTAHSWLVTLILSGPVLGRESTARPRRACASYARRAFQPTPSRRSSGFCPATPSAMSAWSSPGGPSTLRATAAFEARRYPTRAAIGPHLGPFGEEQFEAGLDVIVRGIEAMAGSRPRTRRLRRR